MKRLFGILAVCLLICALIPVSFAEDSIRGYEKGNGYVYVQLGTYPTDRDGTRQPVLWRVLGIDEETSEALLLTEYIIDIQQVIFCDNVKDSDARKFRLITDYGESDLNVWMNETMLTDLLGDDPLLAAVVEKQYGRLYPLTDEQHLNPDYGFSATRWSEQKSRMCTATEYAKHHTIYENYGSNNPYLYVDTNGCSSYWSATVKNPEDVKLSLVGYNGHLSYGVYTRVNVGVRPALALDLNQCSVVSGTGTIKDPFVLEYTAEN